MKQYRAYKAREKYEYNNYSQNIISHGRNSDMVILTISEFLEQLRIL